MLSGGFGTAPADAPALRRFSAFLAPAAADGAAAESNLVHCRDSECTYTVPARSTLTVTLELKITPSAADGDVTLTLPGSDPVSLPVTVASGLSEFRLGESDWKAGTTVADVPLTAHVADGVTTIGTVTLRLHNGNDGDLWITDYPDTCAPVDSGSITCTGSLLSDGTLATFGDFSITPMPNADGPQPITAALPGGRSAQVVGADGNVIDASPRDVDDTIDMAGNFRGAIVETHTMACSQARVLRTDGNCDMQSTPGPSITVPGDSGDTIVWAGLLWAAGSVKQGASLDSVILQPVDSDACDPNDAACARQLITSQQNTTLDDGRDGPPLTQMQHWFGTVDVAKIHPGQTLTIADFPAATSFSGALPMGGWALAVIWTDPTSADPTRVTFARPEDGAFPNGRSHSAAADIPGGATSADILLWGTDAVGHKSIEFGDGSVDYKAWQGDNQFSGPFSGTDDDGYSIGMDSFTVVSSTVQTEITIDEYEPSNGNAHNGDTFLWDAVLTVGPA